MSRVWNPKWLTAGFWVAGVALALGAGCWQRADNAARTQTQFEMQAERLTKQAVGRMGNYELALRSTERTVTEAGKSEPTLERFRRYSLSRDASRGFFGATGFGFVRRVSPSMEASFVASTRAEGQAGFAIRQAHPHDHERYVVQYSVPEARNAAVIGQDLAAQPAIRAAADRALEQATPSLAGPLESVLSKRAPSYSYLLLMPVFRAGEVLPTPAARRAAGLGWTYAAIAIDEALKGLDFRHGEFSLCIEDVSDAGSPVRLLTSPNFADPAALNLSRQFRVPLYGRNWVFEVKARPVFVERLVMRDARAVAVIGVLLATLLAALLYYYLTKVRVLRLARLEAPNTVLSLVESLADAMPRRPAPVIAPPDAQNSAPPPPPPPKAALPAREAEEPETSPQHGLRLPGVRLLAADDSSTNLDVVRRIVESEGASVVTVSNGREAVEYLRANPDAFDAVLMDVHMPLLDGNEATVCIRKELRLTKLPVIALTAGTLYSERQQSLDAGMSDFVTKPFNPHALLRTTRKHVERYRGAPLPVVERPDAQSPAVSAWPEIDGIDGRDVETRLSGDRELFIRMLGRIFGEFGGYVSSIPLPESDAARAELTGRMHKLRGAVGLLGAKALQHLAERAETGLRAGQGAELRPVLDALSQSLQNLQRAATPLLGAPAPVVAAVEDASAPPLDPNAVQALAGLLAEQNLAAFAQFAALQTALRGALAAEDFGRLNDAMEKLRFQDAAQILSTVLPH